jgi:exodeoxyribonuclease VIII
MTHAEYAAIPAANFSTLKCLDQSPAHYRHRLTVPREDGDALRKGRAVHCAVFEPERFAASWPAWDERRAGKEWAEFLKGCGGDYLTATEAAWTRAVAAAVRSDRHAAPLIEGGRAEFAIRWTDAATGIACKARLDYWTHAGIVDLKTCRDASPGGFGRAAAKYMYYVQMAFYFDGLVAASGTDYPAPVLLAVETEAPHVVQAYRLTDDQLEAGRDLYRGWLARLAECRATDRWPGYADGIADLALPGWVWGDEEGGSGLDGLGLEFGGDAEEVA